MIPGSLTGIAVLKPAPGSTFSATVGVPLKFFGDDSDLDALQRYFDSEEDPSLPMRIVSFQTRTE